MLRLARSHCALPVTALGDPTARTSMEWWRIGRKQAACPLMRTRVWAAIHDGLKHDALQ